MDGEEQSNRMRVSKLFVRGGLFHAVIDLPLAEGPIEIVLHGISTIEDAVRAVKTFCGTITVPLWSDDELGAMLLMAPV